MRNPRLDITLKIAGLAAVAAVAAAVQMAPALCVRCAWHGSEMIQRVGGTVAEALHLPPALLGLDSPSEGRARTLEPVKLAEQPPDPAPVVEPALFTEQAAPVITVSPAELRGLMLLPDPGNGARECTMSEDGAATFHVIRGTDGTCSIESVDEVRSLRLGLSGDEGALHVTWVGLGSDEGMTAVTPDVQITH